MLACVFVLFLVIVLLLKKVSIDALDCDSFVLFCFVLSIWSVVCLDKENLSGLNYNFLFLRSLTITLRVQHLHGRPSLQVL